jgi:hypothetical protein
MNTAAAPSILLGSLFLIAAFFTNTLQSVFGKSLEGTSKNPRRALTA